MEGNDVRALADADREDPVRLEEGAARVSVGEGGAGAVEDLLAVDEAGPPPVGAGAVDDEAVVLRLQDAHEEAAGSLGEEAAEKPVDVCALALEADLDGLQHLARRKGVGIDRRGDGRRGVGRDVRRDKELPDGSEGGGDETHGEIGDRG